MMQIVLIGLGAGAASALLFASIASGSPLSFVLANFAQLPILLAAIGWTHLAGLLATLVASVGLALATSGSVALTATSLLNLWLAALIVRISGRLKRPWPQIAQMTFPPFAATVLAIAVAGTFLPDLIGLASGVFTASLLLAFALLGFAVLHTITRGMNGRGFMLTGTYFIVGLFGWPIVLMSLVGLFETMASLRAR